MDKRYKARHLQPIQKPAVSQLAAPQRCSNIVKEVEKVRKQQEKKIPRQAQKKALQQNPNWDLKRMIMEFHTTLDFKPISITDPIQPLQICVAVRKRPMNKKESARKEVDVITVPNKNHVIVHEAKLKVDSTKYLNNRPFKVDYAFDENADNQIVYRFTAKPLVQTLFEGGVATCLAYGQTGSGKTHTMAGGFISKSSQDCSKGIYALSMEEVFYLLNTPQYRHEGFVVNCSFFEIYRGKVFDLLNERSKLDVLEDTKQKVQIVGLIEKKVHTVENVINIITQGNSVRSSGQTSANQHSSRSHAVFQIILRRPSGHMHGKFILLDLAGSEGGEDSVSANKQTQVEAAEINKSLLALKECIRALGRKGARIPFRASMLTQVLKDSFTGENSRTCMIAMISPGKNSREPSLNTLRFADGVKQLAAEYSEIQKNARNVEEEQKNNLALFCKSNDDEESDDSDRFYESVSHLLQVEDDILESHKAVIEDDGQSNHSDRFYESVSHLLQVEDDILESHKAVIEDDGQSNHSDRFYESVSHLLQVEDDILESHKAVIEDDGQSNHSERFYESVSHLLQVEDDILESHKAVIEDDGQSNHSERFYESVSHLLQVEDDILESHKAVIEDDGQSNHSERFYESVSHLLQVEDDILESHKAVIEDDGQSNHSERFYESVSHLLQVEDDILESHKAVIEDDGQSNHSDRFYESVSHLLQVEDDILESHKAVIEDDGQSNHSERFYESVSHLLQVEDDILESHKAVIEDDGQSNHSERFYESVSHLLQVEDDILESHKAVIEDDGQSNHSERFYESVSHLLQVEDDILESHKAVIEDDGQSNHSERFYESVSHLLQVEDDILESHKAVIEDDGQSNHSERFYESVSHLLQVEDDILESHKAVIETRKKMKVDCPSPPETDIMDMPEVSSTQNSFDREDIFGQYVASEIRAIRDNPLLCLQTKQSILEILTSANLEFLNPE